jgi:hypothetical protein
MLAPSETAKGAAAEGGLQALEGSLRVWVSWDLWLSSPPQSPWALGPEPALRQTLRPLQDLSLSFRPCAPFRDCVPPGLNTIRVLPFPGAKDKGAYQPCKHEH